MKRKRVDANLKEPDQIIDHAREVSLSESESEKLIDALHALAGMLPQQRSTEKTSMVLPPADPPHQLSPVEQSQEKPKGHGRTGASSYTAKSPRVFGHPQKPAKSVPLLASMPVFSPMDQQTKTFISFCPLFQLLQFRAERGNPENRVAIVQASKPEYNPRVESIHLRHSMLDGRG
jgi:hypothetical protein